MKHYYLLKLSEFGNTVLEEYDANYELEAIEFFRKNNSISLNDKGYVKYGNVSYCIAERFEKF